MNKELLMRRCISLARKAAGFTSPNPMVGALLYKEGRVIAEDYHRKSGTPHAEALVLSKAGADSQGASLFVNLEPCCHRDKRTPPCTDAIIRSKVKEVIIGMRDPNPKVSGRGIEILRNSGIDVEEGLLKDDSERLNEAFIKFITKRQPFVILKTAMTLDGKIADPKGESKWITGEKARRLVHKTRGEVDAILTAIGTVKADNPRLTCRIRGKRNPLRVVIDPNFETPRESHIFKTPPITLFVTKAKNKTVYESSDTGVECFFYDDSLNMNLLMEELGRRNILSLMIEGGASLAGHAMEDGVVDKVMFFIAPKILGGRESFPAVGGKFFRSIFDAWDLRDCKMRAVGKDYLIEGYV